MFWRKKKRDPENPELKYRTYVLAPHRLIKTWHDQPIGPAYNYGKTRVHLAQYKKGTQELERYIQPEPPEDFPRSLQSPEGLFNALDWRCVQPVYRVEDSTLEKLQVGLMFGLLGVLLFFLYLIFTNIQG